ncbi:MAG: hypothetical protein EBT97_11195 [Actinobacteria bacterium]|nr:hypothetical protein [Actinomycetota bacterium]
MMRRRSPQVGDVVTVDAEAWRSRHGTAPNPPQPVVHVTVIGGIATLADNTQWRYEHLTVVGGVSGLDRIRALRDFDDDVRTAYVEVLWGERTFAVHAAIRDLEALRRGTEPPDRPLRDPETVYEAETLVARLRWVTNYLAREWGLEHRVRPEDWGGDDPDLRTGTVTGEGDA